MAQGQHNRDMDLISKQFGEMQVQDMHQSDDYMYEHYILLLRNPNFLVNAIEENNCVV